VLGLGQAKAAHVAGVVVWTRVVFGSRQQYDGLQPAEPHTSFAGRNLRIIGIGQVKLLQVEGVVVGCKQQRDAEHPERPQSSSAGLIRSVCGGGHT